MNTDSRYITGDYVDSVPDWHLSEAPWKASHVHQLLLKHHLTPQSICEVGCGIGEALRLVQQSLPSVPTCVGYDISAQAVALAQSRSNERLRFVVGDATDLVGDRFDRFDLTLVLDVVEHVEDHFTFLRKVRPLGEYTIFHFPLDLSAQSVLRPDGLLYTRRIYGHLHYFTKDTALQTLRETGYDVIDWEYTPESLEQPTRLLRRRLMRLPRRLTWALNHDFAVRLLGGARLIILAR